MTFRTRHTYNANTAMPGDVNKLIRVLESWQPPALLCMNSLNASDPNNVVMRLRNVMSQWGGKIIYRHYESAGGEADLWNHYSPDAYLNKIAAMNAPWAWWNCGNEPVTKDANEMRRMSDFYAEIASKAPGRGLRVILPGGFASGTYNRDELRAFKGMWQAMGAQRHLKADGWNVVMLGSHEYGHVDPRYHTDNDNIYDLMTPATAQAHKFKTKADIFDGDPSDNWLILRTENILDIMAESCGVPRAQFEIDVAITECVFERLPNIETQHRTLADALDAMNGEKTYGYPKSKRVLETLYGKPAAEVAADIFQWMEEVYPDYYRVFCHFSWTRHDDHPHYWYSRYGLEQSDDLHAAWTKRIPMLKGQPPVTNPVTPIPKPADAGTPVQVTLKEDYSLRTGPGTTWPRVKVGAQDVILTTGTALSRYPKQVTGPINAGSGPWVWVETTAVGGWMADGSWLVPVAPDFGEPTVLLDIPFVDQYGADADGSNACGPASGAMAVNQKRKLLGEPEVTAKEFGDDIGHDPGEATTLEQIRAGLSLAKYGIASEYRAAKNGNAATLADVRAHLDGGGLVLVLFERGRAPGTQAYYAYIRAHISPLIGYGDGFFVMADTLAIDDRGKRLKVADADLTAAMATSTWQNADGSIGTNTPHQSLFVEAPRLPDDGDGEVNPDTYAMVLAQVARIEATQAALQAEVLRLGEIKESLLASVGFMP